MKTCPITIAHFFLHHITYKRELKFTLRIFSWSSFTGRIKAIAALQKVCRASELHKNMNSSKCEKKRRPWHSSSQKNLCCFVRPMNNDRSRFCRLQTLQWNNGQKINIFQLDGSVRISFVFEYAFLIII